MNLFLAKIVLTPAIMYLTSATGRRWGPGASGWLMGLPMLAGPISIFICIEQGPAFAAHAAGTTLLGMWGSCAFSFAYQRTARYGWGVAVPGAVGAYALAAVLLRHVDLSPWIGLAGVFAGAGYCLATMSPISATSPKFVPAAWDMPFRMAVSAAFVLLQTGIAGWLGPQMSGLITPYPIVLTLLTAFTHHQLGIDSALRLQRGFLIGMFAFGSFFLVAALTLDRLGPLVAYSLALALCMAINGATLLALRRSP